MAYRSSVHESTGFSPYRLMFGEECTLPMDVGLLRQDQDLPDPIKNPYALWVRDALEVAYDQVLRHSGQAVLRQKRLYDKRADRSLFAVGDWTLRYYPQAKKCKLDSGLDPILLCHWWDGLLAFSCNRIRQLSWFIARTRIKIPRPSGLVSLTVRWLYFFRKRCFWWMLPLAYIHSSCTVGCWPYPPYDNCPCVQLPGRDFEGWCQVSSTGWPFPDSG